MQQVAGEGMPQHVRAQALERDPAGLAQGLQVAGEVLAGEVALLAERWKQPFRLCVTAVDLGDGENFRYVARALWPFQHRGRIVAPFSFRVEETIELAHRRQPPRQR